MTRNGACIGPIGARNVHRACPGVLQSQRGPRPCECPCHKTEDDD